jgi:hypothetical protein
MVGFEPIHGAAPDTAQAPKSAEVTSVSDDPAGGGWRTHWRRTPQDGADLRAVVESWPTLPAAVKAGILAMVRAAESAP